MCLQEHHSCCVNCSPSIMHAAQCTDIIFMPRRIPTTISTVHSPKRYYFESYKRPRPKFIYSAGFSVAYKQDSQRSWHIILNPPQPRQLCLSSLLPSTLQLKLHSLLDRISVWLSTWSYQVFEGNAFSQRRKRMCIYVHTQSQSAS